MTASSRHHVTASSQPALPYWFFSSVQSQLYHEKTGFPISNFCQISISSNFSVIFTHCSLAQQVITKVIGCLTLGVSLDFTELLSVFIKRWSLTQSQQWQVSTPSYTNPQPRIDTDELLYFSVVSFSLNVWATLIHTWLWHVSVFDIAGGCMCCVRWRC